MPYIVKQNLKNNFQVRIVLSIIIFYLALHCMIKKLQDKKNKRVFSFYYLVFRNQSDKYIPPTL